MNLIIATHNLGKFKEISAFFSDLFPKIYSLSDLKIQDVCEEGHASFEENALAKARFYHEKAKGDFVDGDFYVLADDSGIEVEALQGKLGVETRRFGAGPEASDEIWLEVFLAALGNAENRNARFVCSAALFTDSNSKSGLQSQTFLGELDGILTHSPEAEIEPGIPLSSVFKPNGYDKVYSAMSLAEKNSISHRALAFGAMRDYLNKIIQ